MVEFKNESITLMIVILYDDDCSRLWSYQQFLITTYTPDVNALFR